MAGGKVKPESDEEASVETGVRAETPPPGWVEDPDAEPPEFEDDGNEDFLAASRKRREEAMARRGQRRYNLAIRVVGFFQVLNLLVSVLPLLDNVYELSWSRVSGALPYAMNHFTLIDARGSGLASYEHYVKMYQKYDTSYDDDDAAQVSFVLVQAGSVSTNRFEYCNLVAETEAKAAANGENLNVEAWCRGGAVDAAFALLVLQFAAAAAAVLIWYLLKTGDGDVPPTRRVVYSPPSAEHPEGKAFTMNVYWGIGANLSAGGLGIGSMHVWDTGFVQQYPKDSCGSSACVVLGNNYSVCLASALLCFCLALFYRAVGRQSHVYTLRLFVQAAKRGDTFAVLETAGQAWFLRYVDEMDPDGSGKTALHWAARRGSATMAQLLVQSGADPRVRDGSGWNAMHYAARYGHEQVLKNLLGSKHGEALVHTKESLGATPLHMCAASGNLDCGRILINSSGRPDLNARNAFGQTALMLAASRGGKGSAVLDMLVTAGADPFVADSDGSSALHYAAGAGSAYGVERLLRAAYRHSLAPIGGRRRPCVTVQAKHNRYGETAADEAQARGKRNCKELLLANLDLYDIADKERLKVFAPQGNAACPGKRPKGGGPSRAGGGGGSRPGTTGGLGTLLEDEADGGDFGVDGGFGFGGEDDDDEALLPSSSSEEEGPEVAEDEGCYLSDDERRHDDAAVLGSALRRRLGNT